MADICLLASTLSDTRIRAASKLRLVTGISTVAQETNYTDAFQYLASTSGKIALYVIDAGLRQYLPQRSIGKNQYMGEAFARYVAKESGNADNIIMISSNPDVMASRVDDAGITHIIHRDNLDQLREEAEAILG